MGGIDGQGARVAGDGGQRRCEVGRSVGWSWIIGLSPYMMNNIVLDFVMICFITK
jgi:hypothetical protein